MKQLKNQSLNFFVGVFVLVFCQNLNGQALRWKFEAGDRFAVEMQQNMLQSTEVNGKKLKNQIDFVLKMDWKVDEINKDGNAVMQQTFSALTVSWLPTGGEKTTFDSASQKPLRGVEKRISNSLTPIMQSKFSVVMTPRGEIISVEADRETMDLLRNAPDSMEIRKLFTADGISETLSSSALVLPEGETKTWDEKDVVETPLSTSTYTRTYTVDGEEEKAGKNLTKINIVGDVEFKQNNDNPARQDQKITKHSQTGTIFFDQAAGHLVECEMEQEIATETPYRDMVLYAKTASSLITKIQRVK